jgi:hypothetical protein
MLDEAEERLRQVLPEGHYAFVALLSQRSLLAQKRGDLERALELADQGLAVAEASVAGGQAPATLLDNLLNQRSEIQLALGQPESAVADATRLVGLMREAAPAGTHTLELARAYRTLSRALEGSGDAEGSREALISALENFEDAAGADHPETLEARALVDEIARAPRESRAAADR